MIHRLLICLVLLISLSRVSGQNSGRISGQVIDSLTQKPMDAALVVLLKKDTLVVVQSTLADSLGNFSFMHVPVGQYRLKANFVAYNAQTMQVELKAGKMELSSLKIMLPPDGHQLQETEILSEKPVIRNIAGKIIFDVAKTISDGAESAEESLQKIPGVNVDQNGSVTVRGKSNVTILVDGKTNLMAQTNPEQFLKSIPAKNIESIEVNTTPSAKYDASGSGIVINIKLKKGKMEGFNGSLTAGVGTVFNKYNGSGDFNYKKGKFNFFGNATYRDEMKWSESSDSTKVFYADSSSSFNQRLRGQSHPQSGSGKLGLEYAMDKYHALTYTVDANLWGFNSQGTGTGDILNSAGQQTNTEQITSNRLYADISITNAINYRQTFDTTDKSWTIDVAHTYDKHNTNSQSVSQTYDLLGVEIPADYFNKKTYNNSITNNLLLQSDYVRPLKWAGYKIETGVKEEATIFNSNTNVYNDLNGTDIRDTTQSSNFKYIESITAAYGIFTGKIKSFTYSGGLRWEETYISSHTSSVSQSYPSFFPSVTLSYNITEGHIITLSYGRTIDRPGFWMLNNSVNYSSPHASYAGNPSIQPAFTNSVNLEYNGTIKNQSINFSTSFAHTGGTFQEISTIDSSDFVHTTFENAGTEMSIFTGLDGSFKFTKWWDFSVSPGYGYHWYKFIYNNLPQSNAGGTFNIWGSTTFRFWKNASFMASGWFYSGFVGAQYKTLPVGAINATLKKKFFKEHLIVSVSCRDILNTQKWGTHTYNPALDERSTWKGESRIGYLTLTYQFGKQSFSPDGRTKGKSSRIGGGGGGGGGQ